MGPQNLPFASQLMTEMVGLIVLKKKKIAHFYSFYNVLEVL